jgi:hypothetical protein
MKKKRPQRPRKQKARPALGVEAKGRVEDLSSTIRTGPVASPRPSNAPAAAQPGVATLTRKERVQADATASRPATVLARTNVRGWMIFAVFIISWLLLAGVVVIFAEYRT